VPRIARLQPIFKTRLLSDYSEKKTGRRAACLNLCVRVRTREKKKWRSIRRCRLQASRNCGNKPQGEVNQETSNTANRHHVVVKGVERRDNRSETRLQQVREGVGDNDIIFLRGDKKRKTDLEKHKTQVKELKHGPWSTGSPERNEF